MGLFHRKAHGSPAYGRVSHRLSQRNRKDMVSRPWNEFGETRDWGWEFLHSTYFLMPNLWTSIIFQKTHLGDFLLKEILSGFLKTSIFGSAQNFRIFLVHLTRGPVLLEHFQNARLPNGPGLVCVGNAWLKEGSNFKVGQPVTHKISQKLARKFNIVRCPNWTTEN